MPKGPNSKVSNVPRNASDKQPEGLIAEFSTGMAIIKTGTELAKGAAKALEKEKVFEIFVLDSTATNEKHNIKISFTSKSDQGIYIESLTFHRPGEDNKGFSILKEGGLDVVFKSHSDRSGIASSFDSGPSHSPTHDQSLLFPRKLDKDRPLVFETEFNLLNRENMFKSPHLVANMVYSKLDEKTRKAHRFYFQLRWPS
jgi:hypothetical protein